MEDYFSYSLHRGIRDIMYLWDDSVKKQVTIDTLTKAHQDTPRWRINSAHDSMVDIEFTLISNTVNERDSLNTTGIICSIDTMRDMKMEN